MTFEKIDKAGHLKFAKSWKKLKVRPGKTDKLTELVVNYRESPALEEIATKKDNERVGRRF